jgi:hypothetical protein
VLQSIYRLEAEKLSRLEIRGPYESTVKGS